MADEKNTQKPKDPQAAPNAQAEAPAEPPKWLVKTKAIVAAIINLIKKIINSSVVQNTINTIKKFGLWGWLKVFTVLAVAIATYGVYKTAPYWKKFWRLPYQSTFESVADHKFNYADDSKIIRYSNDLLAPQHFVLVNKIVVNIRASRLSTQNPMVAFDLYVRTDTDAAAVEIKDREKQIQDHLQRFCESLSYDQIQTEDGKLTWKNRMKRELNLVLTTGKVKEVFFKTLIIKP